MLVVTLIGALRPNVAPANTVICAVAEVGLVTVMGPAAPAAAATNRDSGAKICHRYALLEVCEDARDRDGQRLARLGGVRLRVKNGGRSDNAEGVEFRNLFAAGLGDHRPHCVRRVGRNIELRGGRSRAGDRNRSKSTRGSGSHGHARTKAGLRHACLEMRILASDRYLNLCSHLA